MAIIKCIECGKEFSDKAVACPNCGCPTSEMISAEQENETTNIPEELTEEQKLLKDIYNRHKINAFAAIKEYQDATGYNYVKAQKIVSDYYNQKSKEARNNVSKLGKEKSDKHTLCCPKCKGHNIDLWSDSANMEEFQRTGLNLNPLHPLTPLKTKTVKKEKKSAAKIGLGIMTGGTSLLVTGTKKTAHNEYFCRDCGYRWIGK